MTTAGLLAALRRRWYVVVLGAIATVLVTSSVIRVPGVYWTQVDVVFLPPSNPNAGNVLEGESEGLIHFAAVVDRAFNGEPHGARLSSASASLYGAGVRDGYSVALVDTGGQWRSAFSRPVLSVEVVGSDRDAVAADLDAIVARIDRIVVDQQKKRGTPTESWITTELAPSVPVIAYVSGSGTRALGGIGLLGAGLTLLAVGTLERRVREGERGQRVA